MDVNVPLHSSQSLDPPSGGWKDHWAWSLVVYTYALITVALVVTALVFMVPFKGRKGAFHWAAHLWTKGFFRLAGIRWVRSGWESLPETIRTGAAPAIFMSNHGSQLDPPLLSRVIEAPAVYIAKKELLWFPFINLAIWIAGFIFIDRKRRSRAIKSMDKAAAKIRNGQSVILFPEGTRSRTGKLLPLKKGGFVLAQSAGVPIVPLAIHGGYHILRPDQIRTRPGCFRVAFGTPIDPKNFQDKEELRLHVQARIAELFAQAEQLREL